MGFRVGNFEEVGCETADRSGSKKRVFNHGKWASHACYKSPMVLDQIFRDVIVTIISDPLNATRQGADIFAVGVVEQSIHNIKTVLKISLSELHLQK